MSEDDIIENEGGLEDEEPGLKNSHDNDLDDSDDIDVDLEKLDDLEEDDDEEPFDDEDHF